MQAAPIRTGNAKAAFRKEDLKDAAKTKKILFRLQAERQTESQK